VSTERLEPDETGGGADYDEDALRNYQLERLRCATVHPPLNVLLQY